MTIDRTKFKTPFYEITIEDPSRERSVKLPHHILRLITKIEMVEVWDNKSNDHSTLSLEFVEGSREPASNDTEAGTKGLYNIPNQGKKADQNISGSITNRTGAITDLRFSGNSGITFVDPSEVATGRITTRDLTNVDGDTVKRYHEGEDLTPTFLIKEKNHIIVTWGYKEDPKSVRSEIFTIQMVRVKFAESSQIVTSIVAYDQGMDVDKVVPSEKAVHFRLESNEITGTTVSTQTDIKTRDLIEKVARESGLFSIVSPEIEVPQIDKGHTKIWFVGQSFEQFMRKLASNHNAVYKTKLTIHDKTRATIVFLTQKDVAARKIERRDIPGMFRYKSPNSIIKSVNINADFRGGFGKATLTTDQEGKNKKVIVEKEDHALFTNNSKNPALASNSTPIPFRSSADAIASSQLGTDSLKVGRVEVAPDKQESQLEDDATSETNKMKEGLVSLEMTTVGYPPLSFGSITIDNIGLRYSGTYTVRKVVHSISDSGYISRVMADSLAFNVGGVEAPQDSSTKEAEPDKINTQLFSKVLGLRSNSKSIV